MDVKTTQQLDNIIGGCAEALNNKLSGADGKRAVLLCGGTGCLSSHSDEIKAKFEELIQQKGLADKVTVNLVGCFGFCSQGPFVKIYPEDTLYRLVKIEDVEEIVDTDLINNQVVERLLYVDPSTNEKVQKQDDINFYKKQKRVALHGCGVINPEDINEAIGYGAFKGLEKALTMTPKEVIDEVLASGIRGRGGAGFPTGRKWSFAYANDADQKYVVCNGDEGDPGAFMDRSILEGNPFAVIEGMMIAGYAIGATEGYFYVRAEYPIAVNRLQLAIDQMTEMGILGNNILGSDFSFMAHIRLGAGAFVCGEETALIASIEGKRGFPHLRPPYPAQRGLFGHPTLINNVETLSQVPFIVSRGADAYREIGTEKSKGTKVFALAGKVRHGGLIEVPMGITLRQIVERIGGGMENGEKLKAVQTGGPSGGCIPAELCDVAVDFDALNEMGALMGSGGLVVLSESDCMVDVARYFLNFISSESCGKCTFCRVGAKRMLDILDRLASGKGTMNDIDNLEVLANAVKKAALCGLGKTAPNPVLSTLRHFRKEYEEHVQGICRTGRCKQMVTLTVTDDCIGCTKCARCCPADAIPFVPYEKHTIDTERCTLCGLCIDECDFNAIKYENKRK